MVCDSSHPGHLHALIVRTRSWKRKIVRIPLPREKLESRRPIIGQNMQDSFGGGIDLCLVVLMIHAAILSPNTS